MVCVKIWIKQFTLVTKKNYIEYFKLKFINRNKMEFENMKYEPVLLLSSLQINWHSMAFD